MNQIIPLEVETQRDHSYKTQEIPAQVNTLVILPCLAVHLTQWEIREILISLLEHRVQAITVQMTVLPEIMNLIIRLVGVTQKDVQQINLEIQVPVIISVTLLYLVVFHTQWGIKENLIMEIRTQDLLIIALIIIKYYQEEALMQFLLLRNQVNTL